MKETKQKAAERAEADTDFCRPTDSWPQLREKEVDRAREESSKKRRIRRKKE
jgi:hypothetical protein